MIEQQTHVFVDRDLAVSPKQMRFLKRMFKTTPEKIIRFSKAKGALRAHNRKYDALREEYDRALYDMISPID